MLRRTVGTAILALSSGACGLFDPVPDGTFSVIMPERELVEPLVVDVIDHTGTVAAVGIGQSRLEDAVVADPADPAVLIVTWVGGMCDVRTTLTVEAATGTIRIIEATEERFGACRSMGVGRSIAIRFDPPLAPEFVEFVRPGV